jgi:hypothetical protein
MTQLTNDEAAWIKAAAAAFLAIRVATQSRPDEDQARDINFLADALHNIGMAGTGNAMFADLHTPADLIEVQKVTQRLLHSFQHPAPSKSSLLEGMFRLKRP